MINMSPFFSEHISEGAIDMKVFPGVGRKREERNLCNPRRKINQCQCLQDASCMEKLVTGIIQV